MRLTQDWYGHNHMELQRKLLILLVRIMKCIALNILSLHVLHMSLLRHAGETFQSDRLGFDIALLSLLLPLNYLFSFFVECLSPLIPMFLQLNLEVNHVHDVENQLNQFTEYRRNDNFYDIFITINPVQFFIFILQMSQIDSLRTLNYIIKWSQRRHFLNDH